jgi:hypothetical protein
MANRKRRPHPVHEHEHVHVHDIQKGIVHVLVLVLVLVLGAGSPHKRPSYTFELRAARRCDTISRPKCAASALSP